MDAADSTVAATDCDGASECERLTDTEFASADGAAGPAVIDRETELEWWWAEAREGVVGVCGGCGGCEAEDGDGSGELWR